MNFHDKRLRKFDCFKYLQAGLNRLNNVILPIWRLISSAAELLDYILSAKSLGKTFETQFEIGRKWPVSVL